MDNRLALRAVTAYATGVVFVGLAVFLPAGTLSFPNGWLFMAVLFVPILLAGTVMLFRAPDLLEKRLRTKEVRCEQQLAVKLSGLMFLTGFVLAGLDFRFGWSHLPRWPVIAASLVFLAGYGLYAEVLRENAFLSRTVEVQEGQTVIRTGLYGTVRHPMYSATVLMFLSMPLILGSLISFLVFLAYPFLIALRIRDEEALLERELAGYTAYKQDVKYRLIPLIW